MAAGIVGIPFLSFWLFALGIHVDWRALWRPENGLVLVFLALGSWMLLTVLWSGVRGLLQFAGHSEIELRGDVLRGIERMGWLQRSWRRPLAGLSRFDVRDAMLEQGAVRVYEYAAAAVESNMMVPIWETEPSAREVMQTQLAPGYPRDWLLPLAHDLAQRCRLRAREHSFLSRTSVPIAVTEEPLPNSAGFVEQLAQPAQSRIVVLQTREELTITMPRGWLGQGGDVLVVAGDQLEVVSPTLFGHDRQQWSRRQLADIRVGCIHDSDGPDTPEVQIEPHPGEGKRVRLRFKDEAEARWLATLLRRVLRIPEQASAR
jgi:hypothetical protein